MSEPEPVSPLPWHRHFGLVNSAKGFAVADFYAVQDAEYTVEAANAYPHLKERLNKALEACKALVAWLDWCQALARGDQEAADKIWPLKEAWGAKRHPLLAKADKAAREALEAEGRVNKGDVLANGD